MNVCSAVEYGVIGRANVETAELSLLVFYLVVSMCVYICMYCVGRKERCICMYNSSTGHLWQYSTTSAVGWCKVEEEEGGVLTNAQSQ